MGMGTQVRVILYWNRYGLHCQQEVWSFLHMCYGMPTWGPCLPMLQIPISNITGFTAQGGGEILDNGGNAILADLCLYSA